MGWRWTETVLPSSRRLGCLLAGCLEFMTLCGHLWSLDYWGQKLKVEVFEILWSLCNLGADSQTFRRASEVSPGELRAQRESEPGSDEGGGGRRAEAPARPRAAGRVTGLPSRDVVQVIFVGTLHRS